MAFVSSSSNNSNISTSVNTAQGVNTANEVNTASSRVNAASSLNIDNLSDAVIRRKLNLDGNDYVAFDKTKVKCYNCHKRGHFTRECRALRGHDNKSRVVTRKTVLVETPNSSALGNPQEHLQDKRVIDSGCFRHMTGNMFFLTDYKEIDGGYVAFRGNPKGGKITRKDYKEIDGGYVAFGGNPKGGKITRKDNEFQPLNDGAKKVDEDLSKENECNDQGEEDSTNSTNRVNTVTSNINAASSSGVNAVVINISINLPPDLNMPSLEDIGIFEDSCDDEDVFGAEADFHNLDSTFQFSPIPITRINKDHPLEQVIGYLHSAPQTRRMTKNLEEHGLVGTVISRTNNKDLQNCLFAYFLSQMEPKKVLQALKDPSWIKAINKMDEREIVIRNKARLVAHGHTQEEGLQVKQKKESIFISQDKYVAEILKKFRFSDVKKSSTPMETSKPLLKDKDEEEVDVHIYQVTPKVTHLDAVKRIFRYLKGQPKLEKPSESDGFEQIVDFLYANQIKYALTVSPTIYNSCIKQFWTIVKIKTVNDDVWLQALIDGKKFVINEASIRHDLKLNDAEAIKETVVDKDESSKQGGKLLISKTTSWNEFSSTMASTIICLANNQKFNFSKYILNNLKKNLEAGVPFYMFPRNRVFSRAVIPLFGTMMVQAFEEVGDLSTAVHDTSIPDAPSSSQHQKKHKPRKKEKKEIEVSPMEIHTEDYVPKTSNDPLPSDEHVATTSNDPLLSETTKATQALKIGSLKGRVKKLKKKEISVADPVTTAGEEVTTIGVKDSDYQMAQQLQTEEQKQLSIKEKSKLFIQLLDARKKHFAALKAKEMRSKPPTKAKKRKKMSTYLKNMDGYKYNQLKAKSFKDIQVLFDKEMKKEDAKRQWIEEENEFAELKRCLEIVPDDEDDVTIKATPLSSKSLTIVDYKIYKEGRKSFFKIIRADDNIWKYQQGLAKVLNWKLFDSCGVSCVTIQNMVYYLLVEKMYLLTRNTLHQMWNDMRLQVDYEIEMAYDLVRLIRRQINEGYGPE
uniref:CCHC-type domain-containing protein n=1 Tax=Tanacetum cinerariifolium TaxID=118510 RepID=A0A6L2P7A7_TANCI|nr:hypothetical protein [Tanacetum cinerariifolium]